MKTKLLIIGLLSGSALAALAQPALEKKDINLTGPAFLEYKIDTLTGTRFMKSVDLGGVSLDDAVGYTIETQVSVAPGGDRGLTIEARDKKKMGFRIAAGSEDGIVDFTNPLTPSIVVAGAEEEATPIYRYAVKDGKVYIYKNHTYKGETSLAEMPKENWFENGDFEAPGKWGWNGGSKRGGAHTGDSCLFVGAYDATPTPITYTINGLTPGSAYKLDLYAKKVDLLGNLRYSIETGYYENGAWVQGSLNQWNELKPGDDWKLYSLTTTMPEKATVYKFSIMKWNQWKNEILLDDVSLYEVDKAVAQNINSLASETFEGTTDLPAGWGPPAAWPIEYQKVVLDGTTNVLQTKESGWYTDNWAPTIEVTKNMETPIVAGKCYKLKARVKGFTENTMEYIRLYRVAGEERLGYVEASYKGDNAYYEVETEWMIAQEGDQFLLPVFSLHGKAGTGNFAPTRYVNIDQMEVLEGEPSFVESLSFGKSTVLGKESMSGNYFSFDLTGAYAPLPPHGACKITDNTMKAYFADGKLFTDGTATSVTVYSTMGATVATTTVQADGTAALDLMPGIYVVKAGDQTLKVVVK